ncbi:ABC transporter substrate-binding protein [Cupriavidus neocaledonicus]|uniref:Thiamine pyrimidine synthase n=1 Tax=Cupriavidus neocaledonicus TaxID=1040979 RepID=A0A375H2J2_9BURK|nr:ABC transporter substrate-binding protein [Cupriavidus neocaledonicus]SOZ36939.1 putative precursor ABC-type nitrate/sulfonate/bicarbonate transport system, periplasmic component [Cupriavidus neocaledonicus]SPD45515.1 NitT/TauT family transport system substrate-binding protein [Cupriavidus neocaledonicus]
MPQSRAAQVSPGVFTAVSEKPAARPPRAPARRRLLKLGAMLGTSLVLSTQFAGAAHAQATKVRFQLDWRFEGPAALFLLGEQKGYYKAEKLEVAFDAGNGSGNVVNRVASGTYDMGFADMSSVMEFYGNNPDAKNKPVAVMMVYNNTPAAILALKKSGIRAPKDLAGKRMGAPVFDAGRRAFPLFARANGLQASSFNWQAMDPTLRETMLVRGDLDAITGFSFTSILNLNARGVKDEDIVVLPYPQFGVKLYGNAVIASEAFIKQNPEAVKAFLRAFSKSARDVIARPEEGIRALKARDGIIDEKLETRRLKLALDSVVRSPDARAEGFGRVSKPRLSLMASQVADAFGTKGRINADALWTDAYLPSAAELDVLR